MSDSDAQKDPQSAKIAYVNHLPDLMTWDDYAEADERKIVRIRLMITENGLEILGDSPYPIQLEKLLEMLDPQTIESMLCG